MSPNKKKDVQSFIKKEIEKSGFPTELEVTNIMSTKGWDYVPSSLYYDYDENKWREIDNICFTCFDLIKSDELYRLCVDLFVECKKSNESAWVFIVPPKDEENSWKQNFKIDFFEPIRIVKQLSENISSVERGIPTLSKPWLDSDIIRKELVSNIKVDKCLELRDFYDLDIIQETFFSYFIDNRLGLSGKEIKLKKNTGSFPKIRDSLFKVNKSLSYTARIDAGSLLPQITSTIHGPKTRHDILKTIEILIPLIIFDGDIYCWEKDNELKSINQILVRSQHRSDKYNWNRLVPIININSLPLFLEKLNKNVIRIKNNIIDKREECDIQIKKMSKCLHA